VQAVDSSSPAEVAQLNETITIAAGPLSSLVCSLGQGKVGGQYAASCYAVGGVAPFTYSIISGSLPPGLSFNTSTGQITGVPSAAGTSSFTVKVTDGSSPAQTATQAVTGFTVQPNTPLTLTCPQNAANVGVKYSGYCQISGGNSPYVPSVTSGVLPPGLTASANGNLVEIVGTPTAQGTSTATITVTDSSVQPQTATAQTTITVGPRLPETGLVTITATSGGITNTTTIQVTVP
jgi:hypothetical protein